MSMDLENEVLALSKENKQLLKKHKRSEKSRIQAELMKDQTDALYQHLLDELSRQKTLVEEGRVELEQAFSVIKSSINYASRIQRSILPTQELVEASYDEHFIVWEPRDTVGGDVYWCEQWGKGLLTILGDCTGHGVPGAFMTLIATGALSQAKIEVSEGDVSALLQRMHQLIQITLSQHLKGNESDDGMELGICYTLPEDNVMSFVGAKFDLFILEGDEINIIKGVKKGIGYKNISAHQEYEESQINISGVQTFYLTTDGLIDQIGGEKRRSYGKRRFKETLLSVKDLPLHEQKVSLLDNLREFQGEEKRRDDVAVLGFRF